MAKNTRDSIQHERDRLELAELRNKLRLERLRTSAIKAQTAAMERERRYGAARGGRGASRGRSGALMSSGGGGGGYGSQAGYPDAYRGRSRDGVYPRGGSAMSHLRPQDLRNLRRGCQALDRANTTARALASRSTDLIIGSGFTLQCRSDDEDWNQAVETWWWKVSEEVGNPRGLDVSGQRTWSQLAYEAVRSGFHFDGDKLCLKLSTGQVQFVEAERVMNPMNSLDTDRLLGGVEVDPTTGRVVAYHVADWCAIGQAYPDFTTRAIPASDAILLCNPNRLRTGQTRGEPGFAACLAKLENLDNVSESVRLAFYIASAQALFISKEDPGADQGIAATDSETNSVDDGTDLIEDVQPGTITRLGINDKITPFAPAQPNQSYDLLRMSEITDIAADAGLPVVLLLLDFRQVNYSSARSAVVTAWKGLQRSQQYVKDTLYSPVYRWRLAMAIRRGEIMKKDGTPYPAGYVPQNWSNHDFIAPPPPVLDLLVEMQAAELADRAKIKTKQQIYAETTGADYRDQVARLEFESKDFEARGLVVTDPGPNGNAAKESTATERADGTEVEGGKKEAA